MINWQSKKRMPEIHKEDTVNKTQMRVIRMSTVTHIKKNYEVKSKTTADDV